MTDKLPPRTSRLAWVMAVAVVLLTVYLIGPRNQFGADQPAPRPAPPLSLAELDDWLTRSEAAFPDLRVGAAKGIVWANPDKRRTGWAIVYLHGFSATRQETAPMADIVAKALGANLYYGRLTGHGQTGEAMGKASAQDWLADTVEAEHIGEMLGERVLFVACSTGATLGAWLGLRPEGQAIGGYVFISPNFGPRDFRAEVTNWPWGRELVRAFEGDYREWTPSSAREKENWTTRYPIEAVFPMMALVKHVRESALSNIRTPVFMLYSEDDKVVSPEKIRESFSRFGSAIKTIEAVTYSTSASQHVLAGDIKAPGATAPMAESIIQWVRKLPARH